MHERRLFPTGLLSSTVSVPSSKGMPGDLQLREKLGSEQLACTLSFTCDV